MDLGTPARGQDIIYLDLTAETGIEMNWNRTLVIEPEPKPNLISLYHYVMVRKDVPHVPSFRQYKELRGP